MLTEQDIKVEIADAITEIINLYGSDVVCSKCPYNKEEKDIGYSYCEYDYDLFLCEYSNDLENNIMEAAQTVIDALPDEASEEDLFTWQDRERI